MEAISTAFWLGLVEGITEFLPVSSTGHLILAADWLNFTGPKAQTFEVCVQFGAIAAVLLLYFPRFWGLLVPKKEQNFTGLRGIGLLLLTTIPGAVLGLLAHKHISALFTPATVVMALTCGALCMLGVEYWAKGKAKKDGYLQGISLQSKPAVAARGATGKGLDDISLSQALGIGLFQCVALWPGFSRSASTIMGGMLLGLPRKVAAEYSFIAAVPLITGASGYALLDSWGLFSLADLPFFLVGTAVAFVSALIAMKTFIALLGKYTLVPFAIYRILLVVPVYWFMVR